MTLVLQAPERLPDGKKRKHLFLAGGISGCPDWQAEFIDMLTSAGLEMVIFNPRRDHFAMGDAAAAKEQIIWEHDYLRKADAISFWFPKETVCPIVLYELGAWSMSKKPIFVGCHPEYSRKQDVVIQTLLARPDVHVRDTLFDLFEQVRDWVRP